MKPSPPNSPISSVNPISTLKQICPWMMSRLQSSRPPISSARMELPMTPSAVPRNIFVISTCSKAFRAPTGVAEDTASSEGVIVMALAKEIIRKHRAARAGLMKFLPSPPKQHLHTMMANTEPITGMYRGVFGPRLSASSSPVTTALPSQIVSGLWQILLKTHSEATAATIANAMIPKACQPCTTIPTTVAGSRLSTTMRIIYGVVHRSLV